MSGTGHIKTFRFDHELLDASIVASLFDTTNVPKLYNIELFDLKHINLFKNNEETT